MNKQQLSQTIWESANKMRSKIDAGEYKDYILGFMFYKFLSEAEEKYLRQEQMTDDEMKDLDEDTTDKDTINSIKSALGYFIPYKHLFSTWIGNPNFGISDVRDALSAFDNNIYKTHQKVFNNVFHTLSVGLSKLGDSDPSRSNAVRKLIDLINEIPMYGKQDYDVLGFVYEDLLGKFASTAGTKAGEFYTPHEVSQFMSDIVVHNLRSENNIEIYDPTSGSGSLLITIGKSVARASGNQERIKYYAQELKESTFNLTRMNLVMRGILPSNIEVRNADTLEDDWPRDPVDEDEPLYVDAVVANPPYSQHWDPEDKDYDPRFVDFGLAPVTKADYAFLLHGLYHLKPDGVMAIVLPHGVLFRGNEEKTIRTNLIEHNYIDAIIGLPPNIFFGTGIPTLIMVLKKNRDTSDILFIDASEGFAKEGKKNRLRARDTKKMVDAYIGRNDIANYAKVVTRKEVINNDYNLNIPRYVQASSNTERWNIYSLMCGGIPKSEISKFDRHWELLPSLKSQLFRELSSSHLELITQEIRETIQTNREVKDFIAKFNSSAAELEESVKALLVDNFLGVNPHTAEEELAQMVVEKFTPYELVDRYDAYQIVSEQWGVISGDLDALKAHKSFFTSGKEEPSENQSLTDSLGEVFPADLVEKLFYEEKLKDIEDEENGLTEVRASLEDLAESLSGYDVFEENKKNFKPKKVKDFMKTLSKKDSLLDDLERVVDLEAQRKAKQKEIRKKKFDLTESVIKKMSALSEDEVKKLLFEKWVRPLVAKLNGLPGRVIEYLTTTLEVINKKYSIPLPQISASISATEKELHQMLGDLTCEREEDRIGLAKLKTSLGENK